MRNRPATKATCARSPGGWARIGLRIAAALVLLLVLAAARRTFPWRDFFFQGVGPEERGACFPLKKRPLDGNGDGLVSDGEMAVAVDDTYLPSVLGGATVWRYEEFRNSLCFEEEFVPADGVDLVVEYFVSEEELQRP